MKSDSKAASTLFRLAGFAVASAASLANEPPSYGPFRLLQVAQRLCAAGSNLGMDSARLDQLTDQIGEALNAWSVSEEVFHRAIAALAEDLISLARQGDDANTT